MQPSFGIVDADVADGKFEGSAFMHHGHGEGLAAGSGVEVAAVAVGLFLVVLTGLDICKFALPIGLGQCKHILDRRKIRRAEQDSHYSISPFGLGSNIPLTIPLLEFLMKLMMVSLSSPGEKPASTLTTASAKFNPVL